MSRAAFPFIPSEALSLNVTKRKCFAPILRSGTRLAADTCQCTCTSSKDESSHSCSRKTRGFARSGVHTCLGQGPTQPPSALTHSHRLPSGLRKFRHIPKHIANAPSSPQRSNNINNAKSTQTDVFFCILPFS